MQSVTKLLTRKALRFDNICKFNYLSRGYISYITKTRDYLNEFNGDPKKMNRDNISSFWSKNIIATEYPNLVSPVGHIRKYQDLFKGMESAEKVITEQKYDIRSVISSKENERLTISEITWTGTLAIDVETWNIKSGDKLKAEICCLIQFGDDDLIIDQRNYDCYYTPTKPQK